MPVIRKLVAVVMADVVSYSRLMERDEGGTHQRLRALHDELIAPKIAEHGGRTVKTSGDGMLLEFPSATSALRCAVELQRQMGARNLYVAPDARIEFRIGINLGDIIVEGSDIIGDGVNVAARLESLAEPGGISVASAVWEQVHEDLGVEFIDAGQQHVKNISKPVRVFRVALGKGVSGRKSIEASVGGGGVARLVDRRAAFIGVTLLAAIAMAAAVWHWGPRREAVSGAVAAPPRSIIVLPFTAATNDPSLESIAASLGGDLTRSLANSVRDATVAAHPARHGSDTVDPVVIARQANVRYLVTGDVRAVGDEVAVNVRLTDVPSAKELGSERRAISRARVTDDQDLLVARVTAAVRLMFLNAEGRRIASEAAPPNDAQRLVARAQAVFTSENIDAARAARKLYEQARERDPTLVSAWICHLKTLESEFELDFRTPRNEALLQEMDNDSRRAVALDSRDARAWFSRAMTLAFLGRFEAALEANDRAVALDPSRFSMQRSWLYVMSGQSEKALAEMAQRNARAGGVDTDLFLWCHVKVHLARYGEAIADCERAVASDNDYWIYLDLTAAYAETGDMTRAAAARAELMKRVPDFTLSRFDAKRFATHPVWIEEIRTRFIPGLRKAGVPE